MRRLAMTAVVAFLACGPGKRTVGGSVSGLTGLLVLGQGTASFTTTQNGPYSFPQELQEGAPYHVVVNGQPEGQVCSVSNAQGTIDAGPVTNVDVACVDIDPTGSFFVHVQVTGLSGGTLTLLNNGGDALGVTANGTHTFASPLGGGVSYHVTVGTQPAGQACQVGNGTGVVANQDIENVTITCQPGFALSGTLTYDHVPAIDPVGATDASLDYTAIVARPVRRAAVQAISGTSTVVDERQTRDDGTFSLSVPLGTTVRVRVQARSQASGYVPDGIQPDVCQGATWEVRVVDNTQARALYSMQSGGTYASAASGVSLHAATTFNGSVYTSRTGAPFSLLDTALTEIELMCQGNPAVTLPLVNVNWSEDNSPVDGNPAAGEIGTSYYVVTPLGGGNTVSELYILGQEDVDTDEYDTHVVAHEFGHFVEDRVYRSDSVGGAHRPGDVLFPSTAFSEGYGNAVSGMTFNDPLYLDTNQANQANGFFVDVSQAPGGNDRGVYSENSVQFFLWSLYENRVAGTNTGSFDRLHTVLSQDQVTTPALTSVHTLAVFYKARFGASAESLQTLWTTNLVSPWNALCVGDCTGSGDTPDPFDEDNGIGNFYAPSKFYPPPATAKDADFWRLYRTIAPGTTVGNGHDVTDNGGYASGEHDNKWGYVRAYRLVGTGATLTVAVNGLGGGKSCGTDYLDMTVLQAPVEGAPRRVGQDVDSGGCPEVTFASVAGRVYVVVVRGYLDEVSSWNMVVTP